MDLKDIEIFEVGRYKAEGDGRPLDESELDAIVAAFSATQAEFFSPIKVGDFVAGHLTAIRRKGRLLLADFADVPKPLADLVANGKCAFSSVVARRAEYDGAHYPWMLSEVHVTRPPASLLAALTPPRRISFANAAERMRFDMNWSRRPEPSDQQKMIREIFRDVIRAIALERLKGDEDAAQAETERAMARYDETEAHSE